MPYLNTKRALLIVLLVLIAVPAMAEVPPGRITVYASPSGALACVDAASYCDSTDATFTVQGNAWHTVTVTEKGYLQWTDSVYVTSDQTSVVNAYLDLNPAVTGVQVYVTPGGGTVCLDNSQCRVNVGTTGSTGSIQFPGVSAGYHTISVESPAGYQDASELVFVELGKITTVTIGLDPDTTPVSTAVPVVNPVTGTIRVYVDRTGSTVCIDNGDCRENVGGTPGPGTGTTVFTGVSAYESHIISVAADGYRPSSKGVTVSQDQVSTVDISLQPLAAETVTPLPTLTPTPVPTQPAPIPTRAAGPGAALLLGVLALGAIFLGKKDRE
jgi:hypothetical protein